MADQPTPRTTYPTSEIAGFHSENQWLSEALIMRPAISVHRGYVGGLRLKGGCRLTCHWMCFAGHTCGWS